MTASRDAVSTARIERFKLARHTLRMSQKTAAKILGVGQKSISDYEQGNPVPTEEQVASLELRVAEQRLALEALSPTSTRRGALDAIDGAPRLLNDEAYALHIQDFVEKWHRWDSSFTGTDDACDFFFFGPERLPVFSDARFQALWSANLRKHVRYNLFWLLDDCSKEELQHAYLTLKRIEIAALGDGTELDSLSQLHVWGLLMTGGNDATRNLYNKFVTGGGSSGVLIMENLVEFATAANRQEWLKVLRIGGLGPVMVAHIGVDFESEGTLPEGVVPPESFSARREENVSLKPNGPKETGWLFLEPSETSRLVQDIVQVVNSNSRSITRSKGGRDAQ